MRKKCETVQLTGGEQIDFISALVEQSRVVSSADKKYWIGHKGEMGKRIKKALTRSNSAPTETLTAWETFYQKHFGMALDLSQVAIPERQEGFDRLLVIAAGLTPNRAYDACAKKFRCERYSVDLDAETAGRNDREATITYAIWVRDRVEADEELRNQSANDLKKSGIKGETLLERLIHELKYFDETGGHLDVQNVTLCSGSRDFHGDVPEVGWSGDGDVYVGWSGPDNASGGLRARAVVS